MLKPKKYIKNGFVDIKKCVMFELSNKSCRGLTETFCITEDYDFPFYKDKMIKIQNVKPIEMED